MGNVPPLEVAVRGTPEMVREAAAGVLARTGGVGLILSRGGGVSPETPGENLAALVPRRRNRHRNALARRVT